MREGGDYRARGTRSWNRGGLEGSGDMEEGFGFPRLERGPSDSSFLFPSNFKSDGPLLSLHFLFLYYIFISSSCECLRSGNGKPDLCVCVCVCV